MVIRAKNKKKSCRRLDVTDLLFTKIYTCFVYRSQAFEYEPCKHDKVYHLFIIIHSIFHRDHLFSISHINFSVVREILLWSDGDLSWEVFEWTTKEALKMPPNQNTPYQPTTVTKEKKDKSDNKGYDETVYFFRHLNQK